MLARAGNNNNNKKNTALNTQFKQFNDRILGETGWDSYEYGGDGREQVEFFKKWSNAYQLINSMSPGDREAFREWAGGYFMDGTQYRGWDNMSAYERSLTKVYDNILDRATLNHGLVAHRYSTAELVLGAGHKTATLAELQAAEGSLVTSKGSMSFGAAATGLGIGDSSKQIEYELKIPAGSKGAGMWIADDRIHGWGVRQREFMTNRDIVLRVGKTVFDQSRNKYIVEIYYEGRTAHDYGKKKK